MIRDITIGQYYPANSILHRLDPRVKFVGTMLFVISLFILQTWIGYAMATIFLVSLIIMSKVPFGFMVKGLKTIIVLMLATVVLNIFFTPGETVIWQWRIIKITHEGIVVAVKMMTRLVYLILGSSLMTLTTTPTQLTSALERLLRPLNKIKVPVHEIAMMMSIALRFIPILLEETDKIMKAQMARGADFESGGLMKRVKSMIPLLVPLFVSAFHRADDLATAMEARCYHGGQGRTQMKPLVYKSGDIIGYLILALYLAVCIVVAYHN